MPTHILARTLILITAGSALFLLVYAGLPQAEQAAPGIQTAAAIGSLAPAIEGIDVAESPAQIIFPNNQITVLNFWATWCVPCRTEMPELEAFANSHEDILLYGINSGETPSHVQTWLAERGITFPTVIDRDGSVYADYRIIGQPTTFVIGADGIITHIFYGVVTEDLLSNTLQSLKDS